jgi:alpha-tubulin suppressor-like RCC1 family protein
VKALALALGASVLMLAGCQQDSSSPTAPGAEAAAPVSGAATPPTFRQVSASDRGTTCALTTDDQAWCWGANTRGQVGNGIEGPDTCFGGDACSTHPAVVIGGLRFRSISPGGAHTCGVTTDARAYCWGSGVQGQVGDGTTRDRTTPTLVAGGLRFREVTSGLFHSCGITTAGRAYCWGVNVSGQIGDGTDVPLRASPTAVTGGYVFRQIDAGDDFTCAVTVQDRAFCWGRNLNGNLGFGRASLRSGRPRAVAGAHLFARVSAGDFYACGLTFARDAYCWGSNQFGQLGIGSLGGQHYVPTSVFDGLRLREIEAGSEHTCGRPASGRLLCWGDDRHSQLGGPDRFPLPTEVTGGRFFRDVTAGDRSSCGVTAGTSEVLCWGLNEAGQLGDGTTTDRPTPTRIARPL